MFEIPNRACRALTAALACPHQLRPLIPSPRLGRGLAEAKGQTVYSNRLGRLENINSLISAGWRDAGRTAFGVELVSRET